MKFVVDEIFVELFREYDNVQVVPWFHSQAAIGPISKPLAPSMTLASCFFPV